METHLRSILKAVTWRAGGTIVTFLITWAISGQADLAVKVGAFDTIAKVAAFYFHERLWQRISIGKLKPPEYEI